MFLIGKEEQTQRQIDRACSAQSPDMLPPPEVETDELEQARQRVKEFNRGVQS